MPAPPPPSNPLQQAFTLAGTLQDASSPEPHQHPWHQFLTIRAGVSLLETEALRQPLYGSMAAFLPAGCPHRSLAVGGPIAYQSLYLPVEDMPRQSPEIRIFELSELGSALFNRLGRERLGSGASSTLRACKDLFLTTALEDMDSRAFDFRLPRPKTGTGIRIATYLEAHFASPLSLDSLQQAVPYSPRQATRLFSQDLGITPMGYLRLYRLFQASVLLRTSRKPIGDIAMDCGYASLSCFYSDYRKYFKRSPRKFRCLEEPAPTAR